MKKKKKKDGSIFFKVVFFPPTKDCETKDSKDLFARNSCNYFLALWDNAGAIVTILNRRFSQ